MTDLYETIVADTPLEAIFIAKEKYGKNYQLIKSEKIKEKTLMGILEKERAKITIKPLNNHIKNLFTNKGPLSLETSQNESSNIFNNSSVLKETQSTYEPRMASVPVNVAKNNYRKAQSKLRYGISGLHDIQEENIETKSEKKPNNIEDFDLNCKLVLDSIDDVKKGRERAKSISGDIKGNSINSRRLEEIQEKLDLLTATIKNLTENSNNFLCENQLPQGLSDLEKELQDIETPQEIIKEIFKDLRKSCDKQTLCESKATFCALHKLIKERLAISSSFEIKKSSKPQVIVLMGPTGVGKTTTIAKLAANFCFNPEKPIKACFLNIDFYKLGAKEQLQKYADIFSIPLEDITSIASLDYCLNMHKDDDLIIVDTAGRSQYAYKDIEELKSYLNRIPNATKYLTVSSTSKYSDLKEIVNSFAHIGFDHIILTKTDETKTIGPAVGMLLKSNKSLAYITHGQSVPDDYRIAGFDFFEEKLFNNIQNIHINE